MSDLVSNAAVEQTQTLAGYMTFGKFWLVFRFCPWGSSLYKTAYSGKSTVNM